RGALRAGGHIDIHKCSEILLHELRNGTLGKVTLELPEMITQELIEVEEAAALKAEQQIKKKEERRKRYLKNKR
ncbi:ribosome biogenesis GTPase YlqF, partial [Vibrio sp. 10N.261.46.C10]